MTALTKHVQQTIHGVVEAVPTKQQIQTVVNNTLSANKIIPPRVIEQDLNEALTDPTNNHNANDADKGSDNEEHKYTSLLPKTSKKKKANRRSSFY